MKGATERRCIVVVIILTKCEDAVTAVMNLLYSWKHCGGIFLLL